MISAIHGIRELFQSGEKYGKDEVLFILEMEWKLVTCCQFILGSVCKENDVNTVAKEDNEGFWETVKFTNVGNQHTIQRKIGIFKKLLDVTTYAMIKSQQYRDRQYFKWLIFGVSYPLYFFNQHESVLASRSFYSKPTISMAQSLWNLPETGLIKHIVELTMPKIKNNIRIYIPLDQNNIPNSIRQPTLDSIEVRIQYNKQLVDRISNTQQSEQQQLNQIIIYMHGGGFLALSSQTQQVITRRWTRQLGVPIFSVDYRMPPEHPFPAAPEDCFKVYQFIVSHIHRYFNIRPTKIVLAGDSAGGNLACSLTGLIMKRKLPLPHGIYAAYPAVDVRKMFSPSKIYALTDPLLYPSMLRLCLKKYIGDSQQTYNNPIASPILLTEQFVGGEKGDKKFPKQWPKTILQVGAKDPLYDDSINLAHKLYERKIQYEIHVYKDLSHGFLNLDFFINECKQTIKDSIKHLQKLLK